MKNNYYLILSAEAGRRGNQLVSSEQGLAIVSFRRAWCPHQAPQANISLAAPVVTPGRAVELIG